MFGRQKLSEKEQDKALNKLRERYDHLITSYLKPIRLKEDFESRYTQALRARMSMPVFIKGEMEMLEELFKAEEKREAKEDFENQLRDKRKEKYGNRGYAQKVLDDQDRQIERYPFLKIHPNASREIGYLYGALKDFEEAYWHQLEAFLVNVFPSERNNALAQMDQTLWQCTHSRKEGPPVMLERYVMMLDSQELYGDLLQESQYCIKEAAFLLHDIRNAIQAGMELGHEDERSSFAFAMILAIIEDFRLKDIKKRRGEQLWQK